MNKVNEIHALLVLKYKRSRNWFVALNVISLLLTAAIIILNLFAIRFNPIKTDAIAHVNYDNQMIIMSLFISLAILAGFAGFFSSVMSFFVYGKRAKKIKEKIEAIKDEVKMYTAKVDAYADEDRDKLLIEAITKIRNS